MDYLCDYEPVMAEVCVSGNSVSHVHMLLAMVPRVRDVFNEARRLGFATADVLMFLLTYGPACPSVWDGVFFFSRNFA